jgi:hypothetical protein
MAAVTPVDCMPMIEAAKSRWTADRCASGGLE